jgi:hypothetical protein
MTVFKWLSGVLINILFFVIYLLLIKTFGIVIPKISGVIVLVFLILVSILSVVLFFYTKRIFRYDTRRFEQGDILSISKVVSIVPIVTLILFVLFVLSVGLYEFKVSKDLGRFIIVLLYSLPSSFIAYYTSKGIVYEARFRGYYTPSKNFYSIVSILLFISILYIAVFFGIYVINEKLNLLTKYRLFPYIFVSVSYLITIFLFIFDISRTAKYTIQFLKVPEVFEGNIPIITNNEFGLISVYIDKLLAKYSLNIPEFPIVNIGDKKVRVNMGRNFYGIGWVKLFEVSKLTTELSEVVVDKLQKYFTVLENIVSQSGGYIFFFNGVESGIIWGLDGGDPYESIISFVKDVENILRTESLESITFSKIGVTVGSVFIGQVEGLNGVNPYFFGEGILESQVLSKYPKNEGIFFSGKIKNLLIGQYIGEVKLKETGELIEIYRVS